MKAFLSIAQRTGFSGSVWREGGRSQMQLLIVIAQDEDADSLSGRLNAAGLRATKIDTVGGFLARGNVTLLVGVDDQRVEDVLDVIRATCRARRRYINPLLSVADSVSTTVTGPIIPMEVEVGGAVVFSLPLKQFVLKPGRGAQPAPAGDSLAGAPALRMGLQADTTGEGRSADEGGRMNLVLSIVRKEDADMVVGGLLAAGYRVTRINTAGTFLRRGNVTLLIGVEEEKVDAVLRIIETSCRRREEVSPVSEGMPRYSATTFVLDVARLVRV
jgi:uncharacterized protein YaaQ